MTVSQSAGADVVAPQDRVAVAERDAAVDHFLAAALHLRVVALPGGEVEVFGAFARSHRTGRAAAQADQHRRAADHDHRVAGRQQGFLDRGPVEPAPPQTETTQEGQTAVKWGRSRWEESQ